MKRIMLVVFLSLFAQMFSATYTVDGYAYLEGGTDHSGTEVFFQRVAPDTSFSYTVYTDNAGYYSSVVEGGWYDITYSHNGFFTKDTADVSLYSNETLANQTLHNLTNNISGSISGVLTKGVYTVTDTLFVNENDSLTIESGTVLNFNYGSFLSVNGYLSAEGTENDSIYFNGYPYSSNEYIATVSFSNTSFGSVLKYCYLASFGSSNITLFINAGSTYIMNSDIISDYSGVSIGAEDFLLKNSTLKASSQGDFGIGFNGSTGRIENCIIKNFYEGVRIQNSNIRVENSLIYNSIAFITLIGSDIFINNSTFYGGGAYGISVKNSILNAYNTNIIGDDYGGGDGIDNSQTEPGTIDVLNCNIYRFNTNFRNCGPYLGVIVTTNANGDPCDSYQNISMDPRFTTGFKLLSDSPCIDSGNNTIVGYTFPTADLAGNYRIWDGNGDSNSIVDMGAYEYGAPQVMLAPQNITGNMSDSDFVLSWNEVSGASSYSVYSSSDPYSAFPSGWNEETSGITNTSWTDISVPAVKKFYVIVAVNGK